MLKYFFSYLLFLNLASFVLCGFDKRAAVHRRWRVRESTLLISAAAGGSLGLYAGMKLFRHKTKHLKFTLLVPLLILLHAAGLIGYVLIWAK